MLNEDDTVRRWAAQWMLLGMKKWAALRGDRLSQETANVFLDTPADIEALIRRMHADITKPNGEKK